MSWKDCLSSESCCKLWIWFHPSSLWGNSVWLNTCDWWVLQVAVHTDYCSRRGKSIKLSDKHSHIPKRCSTSPVVWQFFNHASFYLLELSWVHWRIICFICFLSLHTFQSDPCKMMKFAISVKAHKLAKLTKGLYIVEGLTLQQILYSVLS